jgi:hypothetical protein
MKYLLPLIFLAVPAYSAEVGITPEACTYLRNYSAEYEPDVDVRGNRLVPTETKIQHYLPPIYIPLTIDLAQTLGLALPLVEAEAYVGLIEYGPKGLFFNNKPLRPTQLGLLCD